MSDPVELPGPWTHRSVSARGTRFHVADAGDGPLVLFLHGFPEFWWAWRHQLPAFAARGYRAVALDLRGTGGSDHTPRGYDLPSLADDVAGVVGALGEREAVIVGHDWGGLVAWTLAVTRPEVVRRLVVVSAAHPRRLRRATLTDPRQLRAVRHAARFQLPCLPERRLVADDAAYVGELLHRWSGGSWPNDEDVARYRDVMRIGNTAYCQAEYHRWAVRSQLRPDGARFARRMQAPVRCPVLQVQGLADPCVLPATARGAQRYVDAPYRLVELEAVGHFPHEEVPDQLTGAVLGWLDEVEPPL